jgi:hypothetical protein
MERKPILIGWPGPWAAWASKYVHKNFWRIKHTVGEYEDGLAECRLMYAECLKRYGSSVNSPAQFMRLFQISVVCRFNDLSNKDRKRNVLHDYIGLCPAPTATTFDTVSLNLRMRSASSELKTVVALLCDTPAETLSVLLKKTKRDAEPTQVFGALMAYVGISNVTAQQLILELSALLA